MNVQSNHFVRFLKEDFKKLNYSKWERQARSKFTTAESQPWASAPTLRRAKAPPSDSDKHKLSDKTFKPPTAAQPPQSKQSARKSQPKNTNEEYDRSSRLPKSDVVMVEQDLGITQTKDNVKMLKLLIQLRRKAIEDLERHGAFLQGRNLQIAREIEDTDRNSVSNSRKHLVLHEKLGSSITSFTKWSESQIRQAQTSLADAVEAAEKQICGLQEQLHGVKERMAIGRAELHMLKTYKDKEFPVKALQIADLKRELEKLLETQQEEQEDVSMLFQTEMRNIEKRFQVEQQEVLSANLKRNLSCVPPVVNVLACHNQTLRSEIEAYKEEILELEQRGEELSNIIKELQASRTKSRKEILFDVSPQSDKCSPDMDIVLNIPQAQWLPI